MNYLPTSLPQGVGLSPPRPIRFEHNLAASGLFDRTALAKLLEEHPRHSIQAATMSDDPACPRWRSGDLGDLDGEAILTAVERGSLWLNIKRLHEHSDAYRELTQSVYAELAQRDGVKPPKWFATTLLISSPSAFVGYHADAVPNILWHLHGQKRVFVYPALDERFAPHHMLEGIVAGDCPEDLPYQEALEKDVEVYDLTPGTAAMWPQNAPHRVENTSGLNVSLSTEHMIPAARRQVYVLRANRLLRRQLGRVPKSVATQGVGATAKIAVATAESVVRRLRRKPPVQFEFEPTFRVDPDAPGGLVDLEFANAGRLASAERWTFFTNEYQLDQLAEEWTQLETDHASGLQFFQAHAWVREWWRQFGNSDCYRLQVLVGRDNGKITLLWPLVIRRRGVLRILEPAGGLLSAYHDVLVRGDVDRAAWFAEALDFIRDRGEADVLSLRLVHEQSLLAELLGPSLEQHRAVPAQDDDGNGNGEGSTIATMVAPFVDCRSLDFDGYWATRSRLFRKGQRKSWRVLDERGTVVTVTNDPNLGNEEAVRTALAFKRQWLDKHGLRGRDIASPGGNLFLTRFCDVIDEHPFAKLWVTSIQLQPEGQTKRPIAIGISFEYRDRFYDYVAGFDPEFERLGVGRLQLEASLRGAFERGCEFYDFQTPGTEFKARWADQSSRVDRVAIPFTMRGRLYAGAYLKRLRPMMKRAYNSVGPALRRQRRNND